MAKCQECGKPLVKRTRKGRYECENEGCPVIYVQYPNVPALRVVIYESSKNEVTHKLAYARAEKTSSEFMTF